jgi:hypothetical protein
MKIREAGQSVLFGSAAVVILAPAKLAGARTGTRGVREDRRRNLPRRLDGFASLPGTPHSL